MNQENEMSFFEHLEDLRKYLVRAIISVLVCMLIIGVFYKTFIGIIEAPQNSSFFTYQVLNELASKIGLPEFFPGDFKIKTINRSLSGQLTYFMTSILIGGFVLSIPFIIYQLWMFTRPALTQAEKKYSVFFMLSVTLLFLIGILFSYFLIFPFSVYFLYNLQIFQSSNEWDLKSYMKVFNQTLLGFGVLFLLPILSYVMGKVGIINDQIMRKFRPYSFVAILVIAAIITPSDIFSMLLASLPLVALYEFSILLVRITKPKTTA